jgi:hypothetical protein
VHRLVARLAAMIPGAQMATIPADDHLLPLRSPTALGQLAAGVVRGQTATRP